METVRIGLVLFALVIVIRLATLQILDHDAYQALATGQHSLFRQLYPERGRIFVHDMKDSALVPIALNQSLSLLYADPRSIKDPKTIAESVGKILAYDQVHLDELIQRLSDASRVYVPIERRLKPDKAEALGALKLPGLAQTAEPSRLYPETSLGGHVIGFLGYAADGSLAGKYGIEGYFEKQLAGTPGSIRSEKDISGRLIAIGERAINPATNGSDIILTIDRSIQYTACASLRKAIQEHEAEGGSVIILDPSTGRILAMCGSPDFDPNEYRSVNAVSIFNNPAIFGSYEPGSVFKAMTIAAGIDAGAIAPTTTYNDVGEVNIGKFTIKNSDGKANGVQTMTGALERSLNTGMIFAMRKMGATTFADYVKKFGFGERTGIELESESAGDVSSLDSSSEIYAATASFGQGISVTPLQLAAAYAALANGGLLKRPYIVDEIRHADGSVDMRRPTDVRRVIDAKTSRLLGAMLVSVVEHGHGKQAAVPGYYIAGKTGTAQVARKDGHLGYEVDRTIGSFAGFGPVENPRFAMVVRLDNPKGVHWAESTAAPLFGEIASFLVKYFNIPPTR